MAGPAVARFPDRPDPPVTPAKLHRIQLIAPLQGQPYWIKDTCRQLGLHEGRSTRTVGAVNVVKNIPEVNAMLYTVKHVIRVDPITFPDGQPANDDLDGWQLLEDGRVVRNAAMRVTPVVTEYDRLKLAPATVRERLRLRWIKPFSLDEKRTV
ncbi:39S ribosomal protein L30, mitochondrial-like [Pollicipes pollicipes]|uniref:39S ribosomal protein L30, mitochondrial-like n=1 Tax=Pollicipes pollicipes TaxID=41117 RepID=UPI0018857133|nr:39S ribosomal protein L30, mitochondrial-like [Pollicipes pollicipes]